MVPPPCLSFQGLEFYSEVRPCTACNSATLRFIYRVKGACVSLENVPDLRKCPAGNGVEINAAHAVCEREKRREERSTPRWRTCVERSSSDAEREREREKVMCDRVVGAFCGVCVCNTRVREHENVYVCAERGREAGHVRGRRTDTLTSAGGPECW